MYESHGIPNVDLVIGGKRFFTLVGMANRIILRSGGNCYR